MNRIVKGFCAGVLVMVLAACSGSRNVPEAKTASDSGKLQGKLTLYTSMQPAALTELEPLMKKALPGVELEIFQAGTEKLVAKLAAEMEAGKIGADVLMVADPAYYLTLKKKDLLLAYTARGTDAVIGERDPDGYFTSVRAINAIMGYNTKLVKPDEAPRKFSDLTDPKWKNSIAMVDPSLSGSAFDTVAALAGKYGWDYFEKLRANGLQIVDGHGTLQSKLAAGEFKAVILLEMNLLAAIQKGDPVQMVYPEDGIVMLPSPIGIMKTSRNPEAAKVLVDWWFSQEAQGALAKTNQHSVLPGFASPKGARPLAEIHPLAIGMNWQHVAENYEEIKGRFAEVMK